MDHIKGCLIVITKVMLQVFVVIGAISVVTNGILCCVSLYTAQWGLAVGYGVLYLLCAFTTYFLWMIKRYSDE